MCFVGTPGSGKTYESVKKVLDNLKLGRTVYTNIDGLEVDMNREHIKAYCGLDDYELAQRLVHISGRDVYQFWKVAKPGSLVLIDEAHKFFNSRDWSNVANRECNDWASTHRHHGYDVVFITQDIDKLDKQLRGLIEWTYWFRKVNYFGAAIKNRYQCNAYVGDDMKKPLSRSVRSYDTRVFACYSSYVTKDVKELRIMKPVNILRHPIFYAIPVVLGVMIYLFTQSSFAKGKIIPGQVAIEKTVQVPQTASAGGRADLPGAKSGGVQGVTQKRESESGSKWKVAGLVSYEGRNVYFVTSKGQEARYITTRYLEKYCSCDPTRSQVVGRTYNIPERDLFSL